MAQDTRKDPRAKVLTMTVRYKSATVDEFIEHHSHDVSRGGIYIKTPSPFQPGTLLKFEIRIADDKPMLQGVGRVVWKRESAGPGSDKPAGMGVKFIKVDESSRALIDRLVGASGDQVSSYDAEVPQDASGSLRSTQAGIRPAGDWAGRGASPQGGVAMRRAGTMIGLGTEGGGADTIAAAHGVQRPSQAPRSAEGMFPPSDSEADMPPPEERTVMKQAAQLLEEALKGAGGSIEELGGAQGESAAKPVLAEGARPPATSSPLGSPARAAPSPSPPPAPRVERTSPSDRGAKVRTPVAPARASASESAPVTEKKPAPTPKIGLSLLLVAAAGAIAYIAWQNQGADPAPQPPPAVVAAPAPMPALAVPPVDSAVSPPAAVVPAVSAAPAAELARSAVPSAAAPPAISAAPASASAASPKAAPTASPLPPRPAAAAPAAVAPADDMRPAKPATATAAPREPSKPAPAPVAAPRPKPRVEEPAPKPAAPADDNPY